MPFELKISLTDEDYIEFNRFWMMRSHYGRSEMLKMRLMISALVVLALLAVCISQGFSYGTVVYVISFLITLVAFQLLYNPVMSAALKQHIKMLKKKGKMGYSPESTMIFGEESFTEITPTTKTEQAYIAEWLELGFPVESIAIAWDVTVTGTVIGDGVIYVHLNNVTGYIIPAAAFASAEERGAFIEFIGTRCGGNIDRY